jgi:hypothetical protein
VLRPAFPAARPVPQKPPQEAGAPAPDHEPPSARPAPPAAGPAEPSGPPPAGAGGEDEGPPQVDQPAGGASARDALLAEIKKAKLAFYRMTVAQADRIEVQGDRVIFSFAPAHRFLKEQLEREKSWLEPMATKVTGRRMQVVGVLSEGRPQAAAPSADDQGAESGGQPSRPSSPPSDLKAEALADPGMQTLLELLPLEIRDVEKM